MAAPWRDSNIAGVNDHSMALTFALKVRLSGSDQAARTQGVISNGFVHRQHKGGRSMPRVNADDRQSTLIKR